MKKRKVFFQMAVFSALVCFGVTACNSGNNQPSTSAQLEKITITAEGNKKTLIKGDTAETVKLTSSVEGVTWTSSKTDVATVDANGLVTAVGEGSTNITASKNGYRDGTIGIKVELEKIQITASGETELLIGGTVTLTANKQGVTWESSDATIASVNDQGVVTANKLGEATISAKKQGYGNGTQAIKVKRPDPTKVMSMDDADHFSPTGEWAGYNTSYETPVYEKEQASGGYCVAHFANGCKETLTFTSSAEVTAEVCVVILARSSYTNLATCFGAKFNNTDVTTLANVAYTGSADYPSMEVSLGEFTLNNGNNVLEFNFLGDSPYLDDVKVYAKSATTIEVVRPSAKDPVTVNQKSLTLSEGGSAQITSSMTELTFKSNNASVVSVDSTGLVRGVGAGETTVSVSKTGYSTIKVPVTVSANANAFVVSVADITGEGISHRDSQNIQGDYKHIIESMEVDAVGTIAFDAPASGLFAMILRTRASGGYSGTTTDDLATCMELKINGTKINLTGTVSGSSFNNYYLGEVTLQNANTIEIKCLTKVPQMNLFRFIPLAS